VDPEIKTPPVKAVQPKQEASQADLAVDEFFTQLQSDMRRPDLSQEAIAAAFQAIQKLAIESGAEESVPASVPRQPVPAGACPSCRAAVSQGSQYCSACGAALQQVSHLAGQPPLPTQGDHHYHHHYHHHYFSSSASGTEPVAEFRPVASIPPKPEPGKARGLATTGANYSRAEASVRRMTQDWAQACNTKQLDDLVGLYATDALVFRANVQPIRGSAAIREFFFTALDGGMGDAEFEPLRVEVLGDLAFEAGRCKILTPVVAGKRREERAKYLILFARQPAGDWKAMVDCWSSDLTLVSSADLPAKPGVAVPPLARSPRKI
jgi:ketosteroid isomerase-like protein